MKLLLRLVAVFLVLGFMSVCLTQEVIAESSNEEIASLISKAEQGDVFAQFNLALMYEDGDGVPQDYKQAVYWFTKAAEQGDDSSQHNLGVMYADGKGAPQDFKKAVYWFTKAAEQGDWHPQYALGVIYSKGEGILQDYVIAYAWFNLAASQNIDMAKHSRDSLLKKMSPNQIEEGQKLSRELYDKIMNQTK